MSEDMPRNDSHIDQSVSSVQQVNSMQERASGTEMSTELAQEVQSLRQQVVVLQRQLESASHMIGSRDHAKQPDTAEAGIDEPLEHLIAATTRVAGTDFFEALVKHLSTAIRVSMVWVGRFSDPNKKWITELAIYSQGDFGCPKSYQLRDTPCQMVVNDGEYFLDSGLSACFPNDDCLREAKAESYYGVRFDDSSGKPLGLLCVMNVDEISDSKRLRNLVHIFAQRAAFELERNNHEDSLLLFRSQIDQANDALEVIDPATGRFVDINQRACRMHGYTRQEYLKLTVAEIDSCVSLERWQSIRRELETTGAYFTDSLRSRKDGSSFPVEVHASYVDLERPYVVAIVRDSSERERNQIALRQSEYRLRTLVDLIPDLVFRFNSAGEFIDAKTNPVEHLLLPSTQLLGKHYREVLPKQIAEQLEAAVEIAHCEARVVTFSYELELPSGETLHKEARLVAAGDGGCVVVVRNVSDQVRAEQELADSDARLRMAIAATQTGVWDWNLSTNKVHMSASWYPQLGLDPKKPVDDYHEWESRLHPDDKPYVLEQLRLYLEGRIEEFALEFRMRHADGDYRWIGTLGVAMRSPSGTPTHMIGVHVDVTERKNSEQRISDLERDLAHVWRVNTMGEMVAALAHEINQPLTAIANYAGACAGLLVKGEKAHPALQDMVAKIEAQTLRAGKIVNRMKSFVAKSTPKLSYVNLNQVIEDVAGLLGNQMRLQGATLELRLDDAIPKTMADVIQIQQVLVNLITNAIEATDDTSMSRSATICSSAESGMVRVDVRDRGRGIDYSQLESLFKPFKSTKPGGLGMGLQISRRIIDAHGGRLIAEPNAGGGTVFSFLLPVANSGSACSTTIGIY